MTKNARVMWKLKNEGSGNWSLKEVGASRSVGAAGVIGFDACLDTVAVEARNRGLRVHQVAELPQDQGLLFVLEGEPELEVYGTPG